MIRLHALDKKLLRDIRRLWSQALAIALVLGCGVTIFQVGFGMHRALEASRADYYNQNRFADVFAQLHRAPEALRAEIAEIDGVWAVDTRVTGVALLDVPGRSATAIGRILSLPAEGPLLDVPLVQSGRLPDPAASDEIAITAPFAEANHLKPGDSLSANLNGSRQRLTITGTVLSPEFIYTLPPGGMMPDNEGFGILFMPDHAVAAAFDLSGAFNDVALKLSRDASVPSVIEQLDRLLEPYGGLGAFGRDKQVSHSFVQSEIDSLKVMATILPPIFFGIAAFLVNMVLARIIALERSEIGLMKAVGYTDLEVAVHYMMLAALIAAGGIVLGWITGSWLARGMAVLYARFYDFPYLIRPRALDAYALSGLIGLGSAVLGAARAAFAAAALPPAVAMQPPAPPHFRHGIGQRILSALRLSQPTLMVVRGIARWPLRSALTSLGLALGVSVLVASGFFSDALDRVIQHSFYATNRQHVTLVMAHEAPMSVLDDARRLPGVLAVEPQFAQVAVLRNGPREKRLPIAAQPDDAQMVRLIGDDGRLVKVPDQGVLLSASVAHQLGVRPGDVIEAEFADGRREVHQVRVAGVVPQYVGIGAYMQPAALAAMNRTDLRVSSVNLLIDPSRKAEFDAALKTLPNLASSVMLSDVHRSFRETIHQNMSMQFIIYITVAVLITVGVAYNGARIQLSERARELASLRILGFTNAEVSFVLAGETLLLALVAQPIGWLIGWSVAALMVSGFESDLFRIPLVVTPANMARSSLIALTAVTAAVLIVRRRIDHLDLVAVMKTRE